MDHPSCEWEPWLSPLSTQLHSNVIGFISFLESRLTNLKQSAIENSEIEHKIKQLIRWKNVSQQILSVSMQINSPNAPRNFIDSFTLPREDFNFFESIVSGKAVKVIFPLESSKMKFRKRGVQQRPISRNPSSSNNEEETKESEGIFHTNQQESFDEFEQVRFSNVTNAQTENIKSGYVFDRCIRKIERNQENREIFTAFRCEFNTITKQITNIFLEEKFIIKRVGKTVNNNEEINERLRREFKVQTLLTELKHDNINKLVHYFEDEKNIFAVSESAGDKDMLDLLADYVKKFQRGFPENLVSKLFKKAVEALSVAHNLGIAHRDVSLENLVLNNYNGMKGEKIEVIDWGHSTSISTFYGDQRCVYEGPIGKVRYMAPELVFRQGLAPVYDPFKTDVFALGVCLFSVLTGRMPFSKIQDRRANCLRQSAEHLIYKLNKERRSDMRINLSRNAMDLLNKTLEWNPEKRPSMDQILNHEFFSA